MTLESHAVAARRRAAEDAIDAEIARSRIAAIKSDPGQLLSGEELQDALREIMARDAKEREDH